MSLKVVGVLTMLRSLNSNKECATDNLPVKLIKLPGQFFSRALRAFIKYVRREREWYVRGKWGSDRKNYIYWSSDVTPLLKCTQRGRGGGQIFVLFEFSYFMDGPLSEFMDDIATSFISPERTKIATMAPTDKKRNNKYDAYSNRHFSLLNSFSKIYGS